MTSEVLALVFLKLTSLRKVFGGSKQFAPGFCFKVDVFSQGQVKSAQLSLAMPHYNSDFFKSLNYRKNYWKCGGLT